MNPLLQALVPFGMIAIGAAIVFAGIHFLVPATPLGQGQAQNDEPVADQPSLQTTGDGPAAVSGVPNRTRSRIEAMANAEFPDDQEVKSAEHSERADRIRSDRPSSKNKEPQTS